MNETYYEAHPAPYVKEVLLQIGLRFVERHCITLNATQLIIGELIEIRIPDDGVGEGGFLDLEGLGSLTVSGLDGYYTTRLIKRLPYAKSKTGSKH